MRTSALISGKDYGIANVRFTNRGEWGNVGKAEYDFTVRNLSAYGAVLNHGTDRRDDYPLLDARKTAKAGALHQLYVFKGRLYDLFYLWPEFILSGRAVVSDVADSSQQCARCGDDVSYDRNVSK